MKSILSICIFSLLFFSCSTVQKNNNVCGDVRNPANAEQCTILFPPKQTSLNVITKISQMTDPEILNHLDLLVVEKLKIDSDVFTPSQKEIALEYFKKDLNEIINKDQNYFKIFQQKFAKKSKDYNQYSKNKDKEKRYEYKEKKRIIEDSLDPINTAQKIIFHEIKKGKFMMGQVGYQVETEIKKSFQLMSTQFTQMMWARLKIAMGEKDINKINPSHHKIGTESIKIKIENVEVDMKPDHPVEDVTWVEVVEFIKKLNVLSKSDDPKTQNLLKHLIPDHQKGDVYDLPTGQQWEFVMHDRGNANNVYFDKAEITELSKYGWYDKNSDDQTHPVARLQPRMIDGGDGIRHPFYDMEGNVWEWNKSLDDSVGSFIVFSGGSYYQPADNMQSGLHVKPQPDERNYFVGFRLARTRP